MSSPNKQKSILKEKLSQTWCRLICKFDGTNTAITIVDCMLGHGSNFSWGQTLSKKFKQNNQHASNGIGEKENFTCLVAANFNTSMAAMSNFGRIDATSLDNCQRGIVHVAALLPFERWGHAPFCAFCLVGPQKMELIPAQVQITEDAPHSVATTTEIIVADVFASTAMISSIDRQACTDRRWRKCCFDRCWRKCCFVSSGITSRAHTKQETHICVFSHDSEMSHACTKSGAIKCDQILS